MDDVAAGIIERETALADFDHAREDFERAFSQVPDDALDFVPEGEDYSLGFLVPHVLSTITMYSHLLDMMEQTQYEQVMLAASYDNGQLVKPHPITTQIRPLRGDEGAGTLDQLEAAHDRLAARLREMAYEEYTRSAPVFYPGSAEAYPTRASDIIAWVTDHYREHVVQIGQLLEEWSRKT